MENSRETYFRIVRGNIFEEVTLLLGLNDEVKVLAM